MKKIILSILLTLSLAATASARTFPAPKVVVTRDYMSFHFLVVLPDGKKAQFTVPQYSAGSLGSAGVTITLAASNGSSSNAVTLSGGNTGDLVICSVNGTYSGSTPTITMSDGTASLTPLTQVNDGSAFIDVGQMFYTLSATGPSLTYTASSSTSFSGGETACADFHKSSGLWTLDAHNQAGGLLSTSVSTGIFTTTGNPEAVMFAGKLYNVAATTSAPAINGVTPTEFSWSPSGTYDHYYYQILSSTFSGGACTKTYSTNTDWTAECAAFK